MIPATMAVATAVAGRSVAAEYAQDARWARFAALVLDVLIWSLISAVVNSVYGVTVVTLGYISNTGIGYLTTATTIPPPLLALLAFLYFIVFEAMFGATPGKMAMRVKVVRLEGRPLTLSAVIARNLLRVIDVLPIAYVLGGILVLATPRAQRIGDIVAGTTVLYRHRVSLVGGTRSAGPLARLILSATIIAAILFSVGFDYFGRPPLVLEGLFNQHELVQPNPTSYSLGRAAWGAGVVTYPIAFRFQRVTCTGTIALQWQPFEWYVTDAMYACPPS